ncbi:MAG: hypothetical protein NKF70_06480 [Methanobacterium sp. ERen5]|nr:MAG: hypothetical protein NKF70_06480 [Methanobacterium sp. ERen5]
MSESELKRFTNPDMNDSKFVRSKFGIGEYVNHHLSSKLEQTPD